MSNVQTTPALPAAPRAGRGEQAKPRGRCLAPGAAALEVGGELAAGWARVAPGPGAHAPGARTWAEWGSRTPTRIRPRPGSACPIDGRLARWTHVPGAVCPRFRNRAAV